LRSDDLYYPAANRYVARHVTQVKPALKPTIATTYQHPVWFGGAGTGYHY
jgi:hypothetical protein